MFSPPEAAPASLSWQPTCAKIFPQPEQGCRPPKCSAPARERRGLADGLCCAAAAAPPLKRHCARRQGPAKDSTGGRRVRKTISKEDAEAVLSAVTDAKKEAEALPSSPASMHSCAREKAKITPEETKTKDSAKLQTLPAEYLQYLRSPERVTSADWFGTLLLIPKSRVLDRISGPLLWMTVVAVVTSVLHCLCGMPGLPTMQVHTLLGSGLSLLLVFRTNSAYQRFQEGRKIWNDILDLSRDLALSVGLFRKEAGPKRIRIIRTSIQAFPFAMQEHVRAKESDNIKQRLNWLLEEMHQARLELSGRSKSGSSGPAAATMAPRGPRPPNRPLHIVSRLLNVVNSIPDSEGTFTNRERVWLLSMVTALSHTVGRCERLVQTPVPLSYARHTARFVSVWTLTLPFALVSSYRWLTGPCVAFVTWALFGILEIGNLIEDPFRRSIELTPICEAIYHDAGRALSADAGSPRSP